MTRVRARRQVASALHWAGAGLAVALMLAFGSWVQRNMLFEEGATGAEREALGGGGAYGAAAGGDRAPPRRAGTSGEGAVDAAVPKAAVQLCPRGGGGEGLCGCDCAHCCAQSAAVGQLVAP